MILGFQLQLGQLLLGGSAVFLLVVFQMLVGLRIIKFKGRTHMKVHKWGAWVMAVAGAFHGLLALIYRRTVRQALLAAAVFAAAYLLGDEHAARLQAAENLRRR